MSPKVPLTTDDDTLSPLPPILRHGLIAVSFFGFLSFLSSISLFCFLTYKLIVWRLRGQANKGYNQFVLLIYNLVIADIQQATAFATNSRWLIQNKMTVGSSTCFAQGWFVSTGDLASSVFIFAIAVHTFLTVIKGYRLPYPIFVCVLIGLWVFIYAMAIIGVTLHRENFYVRAGAWCWINERFVQERLWLHYFWIFSTMFGTITTYSIMFFILQRRIKGSRASSTSLTHLASHTSNPHSAARAARYMVIYPVAYVICTLPLASVRMAAMSNPARGIPMTVFCVAGAMITSNGWLDVLLYAVTRRVLIFTDAPALMDEGDLDTFGLYVGPKRWGTTTLIEGGVLSKDRVRNRDHARKISSRSGSMEDLFGQAVHGHVATKTTVNVKVEDMAPRPVRHNTDISMDELKMPRAMRHGGKDTDSDSWLDNSSGKSRLSR